MRKVFEGMRITDDEKDRQQYDKIMNKMTDDDLLRKMFSGFREITGAKEYPPAKYPSISDLETAVDDTLTFI